VIECFRFDVHHFSLKCGAVRLYLVHAPNKC